MKHFIKVSNFVVLLCGLCVNLDAVASPIVPQDHADHNLPNTTEPQTVPEKYNVPKSIAGLGNDMLNEIARKMSVYDFRRFARVNKVTAVQLKDEYLVRFVQSVKNRMLKRLAIGDKAEALQIIASDDHQIDRARIVDALEKLNPDIRDIYQVAIGESKVFIDAGRIGYFDIVQWMLQDCSDISYYEKGIILGEAAKNGYLNILQFGQQECPNILDKSQLLVLFNASVNGHLEIVKWMLNPQNKIDISSHTKRMAFTGAAFKGHLNIVEFMLQNCPDISDDTKREALRLAIESNQTEIANYLRSQGVQE